MVTWTWGAAAGPAARSGGACGATDGTGEMARGAGWAVTSGALSGRGSVGAWRVGVGSASGTLRCSAAGGWVAAPAGWGREGEAAGR